MLATPDQCDPDGDGVIDGDAPAACELVTVRLSGLARTNTGTGGSLLHFVVPHDHTGQGPIPGIDGRAPDVTDADREKMLAQLRDWAFGEVSTICTGGFRTDGRCPTSGASIRGDVPVLAVAGAIPLDTLQGEQIVDEGGRGALDDVLGNLDALFASTDSPVERRAAPLGVYLHALQDRVSHFRCGDASFSTGEAGQDVEIVFNQVECAQPVHALRHAWEVGVDPATVPEDERTTPAAPAITYDELRAWATARGIAAADSAKPAVRARHLATMGRVLSIPDGEARVRAMEQAVAQAGFEQMPGHGT